MTNNSILNNYTVNAIVVHKIQCFIDSYNSNNKEGSHPTKT